MKKIFTFLLTIVSIMFLNDLAFAGLSVDPVIVEVLVPKGEEKVGVFKITNTGEKPLKVNVSPEQWVDTSREVNTWLSLEPMEMVINYNETKEVKYKIAPTIDSNGELLCRIFFVATEEEAGKAPMIGMRFGVSMYAAVKGTDIIEAEIEDFVVHYDYKEHFLRGIVTVKNKGNVHLRPNIAVKIMNGNGQEVGMCNVRFGQPIRKGSDGFFEFKEDMVLPPGKYMASAIVDYGKLYGVDKIITKEAEFVITPTVEPNSLEGKNENTEK